MERRYLVDSSQTAKERKWLEARNQEFDGMFLSLHTDKDKGLLTEQRFLKLMAALEQEQKTSQKRLHDLSMRQSRAGAQKSHDRTFIKEIRCYTTIEELDESVLNRFISKILIGEVKKVDGQKVQIVLSHIIRSQCFYQITFQDFLATKVICQCDKAKKCHDKKQDRNNGSHC